MIRNVTKSSLTDTHRAVIVSRMREEILGYWDGATLDQIAEGSVWYVRARDLIDAIAHRHNSTREQVAAIVAITSPRKQWDQNLRAAEQCVALGEAVKVMGNQIPKINRVLAGETPHRQVSGPKVTRFYSNLIGDYSRVTIDIWALRVALGNPDAGDLDYKQCLGTATRYAIVEDAYKAAAEYRNVTPAVMQAVTWVVARG